MRPRLYAFAHFAGYLQMQLGARLNELQDVRTRDQACQTMLVYDGQLIQILTRHHL